ncbi:MAG: hypothetical protein KAK00_09775 [Nanoarchaeota archaeon]|nr:hypothetical protein [Nanoarchaeota archaeon]
MEKTSEDVITLDSVIKTCLKDYKLVIPSRKKKKYHEFLNRRLHSLEKKLNKSAEYILNFKPPRSHSQQYIYSNFLVRELYIWSILMMDTKVKIHLNEESYIDTNDKLIFLRARGSERALWHDEQLYNVYRDSEDVRRRYKKYDLPNYTGLINGILKDKDIMKIRGELDYKENISSKKRENYHTMKQPRRNNPELEPYRSRYH